MTAAYPPGPPPYAGGLPAAEPTCYRHPNRPTLVRCVRCNRPICPECMRPASVGFQCPDDAREGRASQRAPRTSVGAKIASTWSSPYATYTLVALNLLVYFVTGAQAKSLTNPGGTTFSGFASGLFGDWVLWPYAVAHDHAYYRLLTSAFLHLSPVHIVANMFTLVIIGPPLERMLGRWRFGAVYLLAALGGGVAVYLFDTNITAGASGAIYGLFGAALVLSRKLGLDLNWLVGTIVLNFVFTFSVSGISKLGHIGGFIVGVLATLAIAGWPSHPHRLPAKAQVSGLVVLFVALAVATVVRTNTFPSIY